MTSRGFARFETAIGRCGVAWGERGIEGIWLPGPARRAPAGTPPPAVRDAIAAMTALLAGEPRDLGDVAIDLSAVPPFHRRVYELARTVPPGATVSYGWIAERLGARGAARAVGQALGKNPFPIVVPCHRVVAAGGKLGGFSAAGGVATKRRMLAIERGDADADPAIAQLRRDPALARVIDAVGPCRLEVSPAPSLYAALARAIIHQQLSTKAAATIAARVEAIAPTAAALLAADDDALRGAGLSRGKLLALRDLASRAATGALPTLDELAAMSDGAIVDRLTEVRGIGRWTVEMLLIFRLGRPDVLPVDDYGLRRGLARALGRREPPSPEEVARRGARWAPYRSIASWYLWRALER